MDELTILIKKEIKSQYRSLRKFSASLGIPHTTLVSALKNGIGGTAYDTIVKICKALNIYTLNYDSYIVLSDVEIMNKFFSLDVADQQAIKNLIDPRCKNCNGEFFVGNVAAFGGKSSKSITDKQEQKIVIDALRKINSKDNTNE